MQTKRISDKISLKQGTIFSIKRASFDSKDKDKNKKLNFGDIYPEVNLDQITYGIVLSQSCDLVMRKERIKTPYITVALLEPINKLIEQQYEGIDKFLHGKFCNYDSNLYLDKEGLNSKVDSKFGRLFSNKELFYFFISVDSKERKRIFYVNLVKAFPLKSMHYQVLAKNAKYELTSQFSDKLGNMLSHIYGRVAIPDYTENQIEELKEIADKKLILALKKSYKGTKNIYKIKKTAKYKDFHQKMSKAKSFQKKSIVEEYIPKQ